MLKNQKLTLLSASIVLILIASCSKSKSEPSTQGALGGNWNFVSLHMQSQATIQVTAGPETDKSVTNTNYTTIKNAGVFVFTADSMVAKGFTYTIADSLYVYDYENGIFTDSTHQPYNLSFPPINTSAAYKLIGTDSLYFPGGGSLAGLAGSQATVASGAKFVINGNTMTITGQINQTSSPVIQGITANEVETGAYTITLQK